MRLRGEDVDAHVATLLADDGVRPEECFGVGPDRHHDHLWLART